MKKRNFDHRGGQAGLCVAVPSASLRTGHVAVSRPSPCRAENPLVPTADEVDEPRNRRVEITVR